MPEDRVRERGERWAGDGSRGERNSVSERARKEGKVDGEQKREGGDR